MRRITKIRVDEEDYRKLKIIQVENKLKTQDEAFKKVMSEFERVKKKNDRFFPKIN